MFQKKWFIGTGAVIIIVIIAGFGFLMRPKKQHISPSVQQKEMIQNEVSKQQNSQKNIPVETVHAGYKKVSIKKDLVGFSFEVPEKWLTETRRSEWKSPTVDQMREFLMTKQYIDYPSNVIQGMSDSKIKEEFSRKLTGGTDLFPIASVSARNFISYTDLNFDQIDFYVLDGSVENIVLAEKQQSNSSCKEWGRENFTCKIQWKKVRLEGKDVDVEVFPVGVDKNGKEFVDKENRGGEMFFLQTLNSDKVIEISKQAKGSLQFEADFAHLLATFKFENLD